MHATWFIGLGLIASAASVSAGALLLMKPARPRRVPIAAGALTVAAALALAWALTRTAMGDAAPAFEAIFLQCAALPIALFFGSIVGMVTHWRRTRHDRAN